MTMKILLLDSDKDLQEEFLNHWSVRDTEIIHSSGGSGAIKLISSGAFGAVFLSTEFLTIDRLDILTLIKQHNPDVEVFIIADNSAQSESLVRKGAHSTLMRPISLSLMETLVKKVIARALSKQNHKILEERLVRDLLGSTPAMDKILTTIAKVAPTTSSILVEGETGTGKEFISNLIHRLSNRAEESFITVNCAAIPENLIESELFGSKKGAFTGAVANRVGLFEEADNGTLFLDEIGELSLSMQAKLLRFLQYKEVRRVGENETKIVDVRIIAATNRNLAEAVSEGDFREDLYYRLNIFNLQIPPLRDRKGNLLNLIQFFVEKYSQENAAHIKGIAEDAKNILLNYEYPGNIRELENIIEHAVVLCDNGHILKSHLPEKLVQQFNNPTFLSLPGSGDIASRPNKIYTLAEMEKKHIIHALQTLNFNQTEVAKKLGISRSTLWRKIKELGISISGT
jgi:DNA-binding NtrC family response regulator